MDNLDPLMKVSFMVEITGCYVKDTRCPYLSNSRYLCLKCPQDANKASIVIDNTEKLTKTCPMVRAQFEALE